MITSNRAAQHDRGGAKLPKSHEDKVLSKVGKRPATRDQIAARLGVKPQAVARALGKAHAEGKIVKTAKGYQRA